MYHHFDFHTLLFVLNITCLRRFGFAYEITKIMRLPKIIYAGNTLWS